MLAKDLFTNSIKILSAKFNSHEANKLSEILFMDMLNIYKTDLIVKANEVSLEQQTAIENSLKRLLLDEPVQYVTGRAHFFDLVLKVTKDVLIPRPETEELIEWICADVHEKKMDVIDIGTGSGCIPILLKKFNPDWSISATDISTGALIVAKENAFMHKTQIEFIEDDISASAIDKKFDLIVSNPPYIFPSEKGSLAGNVLKYEPHIALFEPEGKEFHFYHSIIQFAMKNLKSNGQVFVEINQEKSGLLKSIFGEHFWEVILKKDISGNHRMLSAKGIKS